MILPSGQCGSHIMIVGSYPSREELDSGTAFASSGGWELAKMFSDLGLALSSFYQVLATHIPLPKNDPGSWIALKKKDFTPEHRFLNEKLCLPILHQAAARLKEEILRCQPNQIIALGDIALFLLTGELGVGDWRGSELPCILVPGYKVIPTYDPRTILAQWKLRPIMLQDLRRAVKKSDTRELNPPNYQFQVRPSYPQTIQVLDSLLSKAACSGLKLAADIETSRFQISCLGVAWSKTEALCIPFMDATGNYWNLEEEVQIVYRLWKLMTHLGVELVGQNWLFDAQYIHRSFHFIPKLTRDTMLLQHICFPGMPKSLDHLSSMYAEYHRYWKGDAREMFKHEGKSDD